MVLALCGRGLAGIVYLCLCAVGAGRQSENEHCAQLAQLLRITR